MRSLIVLGVLAMGTLCAQAAHRVRVAQLEETITTAIAAHKSDADIAKEVAGLELSERLSETTLDRFAASLPLQPRTALALQLLADQSAFLDPPASELPATANPDPEAQQKMLQSARAYAVQTWTTLPNFFASRVTTRFDDGAQVVHKGEWPVRAGLHPVGTSNREITFRDGKEVLEQPGQASAGRDKAAAESGLRSWGEFGPALTIVLSDMVGQKVEFSHWEQVRGRLAAVFHYQVPHEASHYSVFYREATEEVLGRTQFGYGGQQRSAQQVANIPRTTDARMVTETPAYHGAVAIDPATGAVLRLTIETELSRKAPLLRAATVIDYGPVTLGDRTFICPARSMALSVEGGTLSGCYGAQPMTVNGVGDDAAWQSHLNRCDNTPVLLINETRFTDYHRLGSTARILADAAPQSGAAEGAGNADPGVSATANESKGGVDTPERAAPPATADGEPAEAHTNETPTAAFLPTPASAPVAVPAAPVVPEISMSAAAGVPDVPANSLPGANGGFSLRVTSRLVDVGLVAFDKKGRPVTDLKRDEIELYDNGHKQEIRFFTPGTAAGVSNAASENNAPDPKEESFSNRGSEAAAPGAQPGASAGATILLIDESHIAWTDMNNARGQMLKFLSGLRAGERAGLYAMNGRGFRVLTEATADHAALSARLTNFMPTAQSVAQAQEEETRNRQSFEEVHNVADLDSVNGNHADAPDSSQTVDPQLRSMGSDPARASLVILTQVARHLAALPGHKNLVWVSTDNVFADWQEQQVGVDKGPANLDRFALHAREAMNEAHTAVYPFDVSQLEGGAIGADIQHRNVELTPAAADNAALATAAQGAAPPPGQHNMQPGRITEAMSQDLHPIQGEVRDLAAATGGRTVRRAGDLTAALNGIVDDGRATYQLSFAPQGEADGTYHNLEIKLAGRRGLTLRYRTGYLYEKEPATLKDRFQQAVWRPVDVSEIAVTASVVPMGSSSSVKVSIAGNDLALEQQADRWMDKLDIFFIERDDAGLHAHVQGQTLGLRLKAATYQNLLASGVPFEHAVTMQPGMASLRVVVVDENSGRMGSVTIPGTAFSR